MGQFGFGHNSGRNWSQIIGGVGVSSLPQIRPSAAWDGSPATRFSVVPSDPSRTTAKPAVRLIEPPNQFYTNKLVIGAMAFANDGGTLIGGIDRVRFHYEGTTLDVIEPSLRSLTHADGSTYSCLGYWVELGKPPIASM